MAIPAANVYKKHPFVYTQCQCNDFQKEKDLKVIREAKIREEMLDREASLRRARAEASLSDGISWGMGEDAIEEAEDDGPDVEGNTSHKFVSKGWRLEDAGYVVGARVLELLCCWGLSDHLVLHPLDIEGVVEDSISSSWKSQGLALLQGFVATLCTSFLNHDC
ncbi:hypothetical protein GOBAR_DD34795 [Gossypium barbadense]|nr:hypothetical protein GOBAR_DD34795 [Gossypium barbadense]